MSFRRAVGWLRTSARSYKSSMARRHRRSTLKAQRMLIRFTCPRGHKMSAPDDKAGSMGKCPQCETMFEVPRPPKNYNGLDVLVADEVIEFYCPNEHYLRAPAKLQGKRGQCPHCGEKFMVPSSEEEPAASPPRASLA